MDNLMQILFNTNHEMPSFPVVMVLLAIAIIVPSIMRYIQDKKAVKRYEEEQALKKAHHRKPAQPVRAEVR